jgi:hypothetical protein
MTDITTLATLAWVVGELTALLDDVGSQSPATAELLQERIAPAAAVLSTRSTATALRPDRLDLLALGSSGYPWRSVAGVADVLVRSQVDPEFVAYELIAPDPEVTWRLFHLATYGMVIRALRNHRFVVTWRRPLAGSRPGPQVEALSPSGARFDLWFEAAAARTWYDLPPSTYRDAVASIDGAGGSIGVDVMLVEHPDRALLLECKWGTEPSYVGRYGYHQSASYALDALNGVAAAVWSFVVGPHDVVPDTNVAAQLVDPLGVVLGSTAPGRIGDVVSAFLGNDPDSLG